MHSGACTVATHSLYILVHIVVYYTLYSGVMGEYAVIAWWIHQHNRLLALHSTHVHSVYTYSTRAQKQDMLCM